MSNWTPSDAIGFAWERVKNDLVGLSLPVVVVMFIQGIPNAVLNGMAGAFEGEDGSIIASLIRLVSWAFGLLLSAFLTGGMMKLFIAAARGEAYQLGDVFSGGQWFVPMLITLLLFQVATMIGFLLLIIPGIIISLGLQMAIPLVVDRNMDAVSALKESWRITNGHKMSLFIFGLLGMVVAFAGMLVCCVGIIPASAVLALAQAYIYVRLTEANPPEGPPNPTVF